MRAHPEVPTFVAEEAEIVAREAEIVAQEADVPTWTQSTENGRYKVTIHAVDGRIPIGPIHRWVVEVRNNEGQPVESAEIVIGGGMEAHGHGLPTTPKVIGTIAPGEYLVDGVKFSMAGSWTLAFRVRASGVQDVAKFLIDVHY